MKSSNYDIIIIGGGIIGAMTAWHLAHENRRVLVVEANRLGGGATHAGAGMLGAQVEMEHPGPLYDFGIQSRGLFSDLAVQLKEESQIDIELDKSGLFRVATSSADREELLARAAWQTQSGQPAEWLEPEHLPEELKRSLGSNWGALHLPLDHQVRNPQYLKAVIVASLKLGVEFVEHAPVRSLLTRQDSSGREVTGVKTDQHTYFADQVVIAAGAWSGLLASLLGIEIGVYPIKGQAVTIESTPHLTPYTVFTHGTYLVPKHTGHTYIGATEDVCGFDVRPLAKNVARLLHSAGKLMPEAGNREFSSLLTGLRPASHDGLPYIGAYPGWEGLYIASGHWRNGILLSAGTGAAMADLLLGRQPRIDISAFSPDR